jgi:excisionase family DNA binding protein
VVSGVVVPDELAGPLRTLAIMAAEALMRQNGDLPLNRGLVSLLDELGRAARGRPGALMGAGTDDCPALSNSPRSALTVREAAGPMAVGCRQVRRLAAAGAIIAVKGGRDWCIDRQAAEDYGKASRA